jgi:hypothetical protein
MQETDKHEEIQPWPQAVDGQNLLKELRTVLTLHVVLPKWAAETLALWALHTYAFESREVSTYIGIESPERRCGKTTLLEVLRKIVNRPAVTANISSSAFYRVIGRTRPTLMIDEADTFLKGNHALRGILNAGYTRDTAYVVRVASSMSMRNPKSEGSNLNGVKVAGMTGDRAADDGCRVVRYSCWCPKAIAMIGRLPATLADRCIVIRMQRKTRTEKCERMRNLNAAPLRRKCLRFAQDHAAEIAKATPKIPESLNDRAADIWEPLLALADLAGGGWPSAARRAAEELCGEERNPIGSLLLDIASVFACAGTRVFSARLSEELNCMLDRPWADMTDANGVTERWLARTLRPYEIAPRMLRIGQRQGRGYCLEDFKEAIRRYVSDLDLAALKAEYERLQEPEADGEGGQAGQSGQTAAGDEA